MNIMDFYEKVLIEKQYEINLSSMSKFKSEILSSYEENLLKDIKQEQLNDTKKLAEYIYDNVVEVILKGNKHREEFIKYINRRLIFFTYHKKLINQKKRGKYEKMYKSYELIPIDRKAIIQRYTRFFKKCRIFEGLRIDESITNFIFLSNDSLVEGFAGSNFKSIVNFEYHDYKIDDLMKFYFKLEEFIDKNKEKNIYHKIVYEELENIFYGIRFKLIITDLNVHTINKNQINILISLMRIKDIDLSIKLIQNFLRGFEEKNIIIFREYDQYFELYKVLDQLILISIKQIEDFNITKMENYDYMTYNFGDDIKFNEELDRDEMYKDIIDKLDELEYDE